MDPSQGWRIKATPRFKPGLNLGLAKPGFNFFKQLDLRSGLAKPGLTLKPGLMLHFFEQLGPVHPKQKKYHKQS